MKLSTLLLIALAVGIGFFLASEDKEELITDIKDGLSKGKDFVVDKLRKTAAEVSDHVTAMKE